MTKTIFEIEKLANQKDKKILSSKTTYGNLENLSARQDNRFRNLKFQKSTKKDGNIRTIPYSCIMQLSPKIRKFLRTFPRVKYYEGWNNGYPMFSNQHILVGARTIEIWREIAKGNFKL